MHLILPYVPEAAGITAWAGGFSPLLRDMTGAGARNASSLHVELLHKKRAASKEAALL
jgi:hypothetical protein